jgi:hypothetical protein
MKLRRNQKTWLDRRNEDRPATAPVSLTLDYPVFKMSNPHFVENLKIPQLILLGIGVKEPTSQLPILSVAISKYIIL